MPEKTVRLDIPHRDGCNRQLIVINENYLRRHYNLALVQQRDALGRQHRHSWRNWLTLICNDIECPAVALVRCDAIEAIAMAATDGRGRRDD
ncbi:hypothetical protein I5J50_gp70 [Mycobacterium phage Purky]|uniref:Uncharacterized protein n=1 Tax=Mycobacterium phage Purky TaxID=2593351 RepID=A0A514TWU6_9CAUD|nr:hypothetical protein I5J50_gp70 [Mycobacterium phage Purky]QDK01173.1 hypothetical protein SEA_PURKY_70 [Mycobacterium phage Purky]